MEQIIDKLKKSNRVFIASHTNPDGDAIGSLVAMGLSLSALGKETVLFNASRIPAVYRFLTGVERVVSRIKAGCAYDTAVILDCGDLHRVGHAASMVESIPVVINIDHHVTNTRFGHFRLIDPDACATAEIIYRLLPALDVPVNLDIANAIYTGILTDTGSFRFSNTNRSAFDICEKMVARGVDPYQIAQQVYGTYSLGRIKLLNLALDSIEVSNNGKLSMMAVTRQMLQETHARPEDTDGLINYAKGIKDVRVAVLIEELNHGTGSAADRLPYHVSLRSDGSVDVAAIAAGFGGGGHASAAGFSIESTLPEIKATILDLAEAM